MENQIEFRLATIEDLAGIVKMLADDTLGSQRERYEKPLPASYLQALHTISTDPNNELIVACLENEVIGVQQITFIPYLTYQGSWRATIEGVRIASSMRGKAVGTQLIG